MFRGAYIVDKDKARVIMSYILCCMVVFLYVKMSKCVNPFTPSNVICSTMNILNAYDEDDLACRAKLNLSRLRQRLGYSAPERISDNFWRSSLNYEGYYDICRTFDQNDARSRDLFVVYSYVMSEFNKNGFETCTGHSDR